MDFWTRCPQKKSKSIILLCFYFAALLRQMFLTAYAHTFLIAPEFHDAPVETKDIGSVLAFTPYDCESSRSSSSMHHQQIGVLLHTIWNAFPFPKDPSTNFTYRTFPNLVQRERATMLRPKSSTAENFSYNPFVDEQEAIVLATHCGVKKLEQLKTQVQWWGSVGVPGPVSASIYMTSPKEIDIFVQFLEANGNSSIFGRTSFHAVLEKTNLAYPHNILRQLAMDYLEGDYAVTADVDFVPTPGAHGKLVDLLAKRQNKVRERLRNKTVMVLAGFERKTDPHYNETVTEDMLPRSKKELVDMVRKNQIQGFHVKKAPDGHHATNFSKWLDMSTTNTTGDFYNVEFERRFEPYVLCHRDGLPRYWPSFRGFGFNKLSWFVELNAAGYDFAVLRNFYMVHMNHPYSNRKTDMRRMNFRNWDAFNSYIGQHYQKKI